LPNASPWVLSRLFRPIRRPRIPLLRFQRLHSLQTSAFAGFPRSHNHNIPESAQTDMTPSCHKLVARPWNLPRPLWSCPRGKFGINDGLVHVAPRQNVLPAAPSPTGPSRSHLTRSCFGSTPQEVAPSRHFASALSRRPNNKGVQSTSGCRMPASPFSSSPRCHG
jgi:hypothetical protein